MHDVAWLRSFALRYTEAWCSHDPAQVASFYAPRGSLAINGAPASVGRAAITEAARSFMSDFPDLRVSMENLVKRSTRIEYHWTLSGTHATTGRHVCIRGFESWSIGDDNLIATSLGTFDAREYERQLREEPKGTL